MIPLLGIYPDKTIIQKDTCTPMFITALFTIVKTWKQPKPIKWLWLPRQRERGERDGLGVWGWLMQTITLRMEKQQGPTV